MKFHFHLSPSSGVPGSELFETDREIYPNTAWLFVVWEGSVHGAIQFQGNSVLSLQKCTLMWQRNRNRDGGKHDLKNKCPLKMVLL